MKHRWSVWDSNPRIEGAVNPLRYGGPLIMLVFKHSGWMLKIFNQSKSFKILVLCKFMLNSYIPRIWPWSTLEWMNMKSWVRIPIKPVFLASITCMRLWKLLRPPWTTIIELVFNELQTDCKIQKYNLAKCKMFRWFNTSFGPLLYLPFMLIFV